MVLKRYQIQIFLYIVFISILSFVYHQRSFRSRTKKRTKLHHFRKEIQKAIHFGRSSREFWRFRCTWVRIVLFITVIKVCRKVPSMDAVCLIYFFSLLLLRCVARFLRWILCFLTFVLMMYLLTVLGDGRRNDEK